MRFIYFFIAVLSLGLIACTSDDVDTSVATSVSVDRTALTLVIGESETLIATVFPETALNRNVTGRSDDTEIATVDNNGQVTAVSTGATNIVARSVDGNHIATSRVTVRATPVPPVRVTGVEINRGNSFLIVDVAARGGAVIRAITITPANATNQNVTWTSDDPEIVRINPANNQIIAVSLGTTRVTVTTEDGGFSHSTNITVVDGAFIGGAIWARYNVGEPGTFAENQEDAGMLFQWNRRQGWVATGSVTGWNSSVPTGAEWRTLNSPCPTGWRLPTSAELTALGNTTGTWTTENGVHGRRFTAAGGHNLFLPAAGLRSGSNGELRDAGTLGLYWSSVQASNELARGLRFNDSGVLPLVGNRADGHSVRCVANN
jgi:uncharacterized protein (TIGR02145 family)